MSVNQIDVNAINMRTSKELCKVRIRQEEVKEKIVPKEKVLRLYDIPRFSRIKAETHDEHGNKIGDFILFHKLDGAYSYCTIEGTDTPCHLGAFQPLKKTGDYYELA